MSPIPDNDPFYAYDERVKPTSAGVRGTAAGCSFDDPVHVLKILNVKTFITLTWAIR